MFIEKIKSNGLAHLSYLIGDGAEACVIDPRRDCDVYIEMAHGRGAKITQIIETHRNEDLISGAAALAELTGAKVWHGPNASGTVRYAETIRDGEEIELGSALKLRIMETPGHTYDSISIAIFDKDFGEEAVGVFTGDALFVGDVGRTDFYPDEAERVAGLLYDSLQKLVALGDQAIIYPAHGAGSVCGDAMADREFSTIGYERANNEKLKIASREAFIEAKVKERHYQPPYFKQMEHLNTVGGSISPRNLTPPRTTPAAALEKMAPMVLDVRSVEAFASAHLPGALAIPVAMIASFAGYFLRYEDEITLVCENDEQAEEAARSLSRMGYDRIANRLEGMVGYAAVGGETRSVSMISTEDVERRVNASDAGWRLLDVRAHKEFESGHIDGALHHYLGWLPDELGELDQAKHYTVMCGSGARATVAASYLLANGFENVDVYLGSISAWNAHGGKTVAA